MYKVLLVDDEYMILAGLQKLIDWESLEMEIVGTARNGKKALDFIMENPVDIILTDVTMPVLSGIDFIREAQKIAQPFKFIILSGYQEFEYVKSGMQLGASNYLLKPIDKEELIQSLKQILKEFKQATLYTEADQTIFESLLGRWARNELQEEQIMQVFNNPLFTVSKKSGYTVVIVRNNQSDNWEIDFNEACRELSMPLHFSLHETENVLILPSISKEEMEQQLNELNERLQNRCLFFIGECMVHPENVYKSYTCSLKARDHADFYGKPMTVNTYTENQFTDLTLSGFITDLNEGIFSKNIERISKEVALFIKRFKENKVMEEENAKRLMYLVMVNIYLQFDAIESEKFLTKTKALFDSTSFDELAAVMENDLLPLDELKKQLLYSDLTKQTIELVQKNYMEDLNLKGIATLLHVNVMYLGQVFKKETGKSFSKYLNHYRINLAKELLLRSKEPVNDIASRIGYQNQGYFYKNFKKLVGQSPREFRDQIQ